MVAANSFNELNYFFFSLKKNITHVCVWCMYVRQNENIKEQLVVLW